MDLQYGLSISEIMDFFCEEEHAGFTEQEIKQAEENVGASLPSVYREFLKAYGKDEINSFFNQLFSPPNDIFTTYQAIEEELEDWEPEFQEAVENGSEDEYADNEYFTMWQLPKERWNEVTENYVLIWCENQGVWNAGYLLKDLLEGQPDPQVHMSINDDFITFAKVGNTEQFLMEMLREAAYGYHVEDLHICRESSEINKMLAENQIDMERLYPDDTKPFIGTCLDSDHGRLFFYSIGKNNSQELYYANRTEEE